MGKLPPVIPWEIVDRARAPDGVELVLARRDREWVVRAGGRVLMSSRAHASEEALARLALARAPRPREVLVGGLGLGFTLRAALDLLPADARVVVAELVPAVVAWNRGPVAELAGRPLDDRRVRVEAADVAVVAARSAGRLDALLLDVDNGPSALAHAANDRLYGAAGLAALRDALRPGGVLAVWSAGADPRFVARLGRAGFRAEAHAVPGAPGARRDAVVVGVRAAEAPRAPHGARPGQRARRGAPRSSS
jgi:spermidine synthase